MSVKLPAIALLLAALSSADVAAQTASRTQRPDDEGGTVVSTVPVHLVGTWRAPTEKLPLNSEFDQSVWGPKATSVRDFEVTIRDTGEGVLKVSRRVLDARGRVVPGSATVEEATFTVGAGQPAIATRIEHDVKVTKAVRTYPDDPKDQWTIENARVQVVAFEDDRGSLEVRFDPPDGRGAVVDVLKRAPSRSARR